MQEKEIELLFENGVLTRCVVAQSASGKGYTAMFVKKGMSEASISLETRPRKAGDATTIRVFKTIDSACALVKRQIGFHHFDIHLR